MRSAAPLDPAALLSVDAAVPDLLLAGAVFVRCTARLTRGGEAAGAGSCRAAWRQLLRFTHRGAGRAVERLARPPGLRPVALPIAAVLNLVAPRGVRELAPEVVLRRVILVALIVGLVDARPLELGLVLLRNA
eukprot:883609-Pyramimonas_sp.AAC.1